jgi:hypothetical protein
VFERLGGAQLVRRWACWTLARLGGGDTARYHVNARVVASGEPARVTNTAVVQSANVLLRTAPVLALGARRYAVGMRNACDCGPDCSCGPDCDC